MIVPTGNGSVPWLAVLCGKKWLNVCALGYTQKKNLDQNFFVSEEKLAFSKRHRPLDEVRGG